MADTGREKRRGKVSNFKFRQLIPVRVHTPVSTNRLRSQSFSQSSDTHGGATLLVATKIRPNFPATLSTMASRVRRSDTPFLFQPSSAGKCRLDQRSFGLHARIQSFTMEHTRRRIIPTLGHFTYQPTLLSIPCRYQHRGMHSAGPRLANAATSHLEVLVAALMIKMLAGAGPEERWSTVWYVDALMTLGPQPGLV